MVGNRCHGKQGLSSTGQGHAEVHCPGHHPGCDETHRTARGLGVACQDPGDSERKREKSRKREGMGGRKGRRGKLRECVATI